MAFAKGIIMKELIRSHGSRVKTGLWTALMVWAAALPQQPAMAQEARVEVSASVPTFLASTAFDLRFSIGSAAQPVDGLFGISFELHYSSLDQIELAAPLEMENIEFLQPDVYTFVRHEPENKVIYLAVSRKRGASGRDGAGLLFSLPLRISATAVPGWKACFTIRNVFANDSTGAQLPVQAGDPFCLTVVEPEVEVVPNPFTPNDDGFNDGTEFKRDGGIPANWVIIIMDRSGRTVRELRNGENVWDGKDSSGQLVLPGAYLYVIKDGERFVRRGLLGVVR